MAICTVSFIAGCGSTPNTNDNSNNNVSGLALTGKVNATAVNAKRKNASLDANEKYTIVAQSAETGEIYRAETDTAGDFALDLPEDEAGNNFSVAIIGPDGKAQGPVMYGAQGDEGMTGLTLENAASLGTIELPEDPSAAPIMSGADGDAGEQVNDHAMIRLNGDGAPIGVASLGKGDDADGATDNDPSMAFDQDRDGLLDVIDADNNGNGIVDELEGGDVGGIPDDAGIRLNFFMNLKISNEQADTYYEGTQTEIDAARADHTVITFEVLPDGPNARTPVAIRALEVPGPSYMSTATVLAQGGGNTSTTWKSLDYAFNEGNDRFEVFVVPHAVVEAGDTFTIEVEFEDGTTEQFSRMINFVYKNIPRLQKFGEAAGLTDFDGTQPIVFDGSQDLTLVFNPPPDENGDPVTGTDYSFEIFYNDSSNMQLNGQIDKAATFPTAIPGFNSQNTAFVAAAADMTYDENDNTYTVTLPKEIFVDNVQTSGGAVAVDSYKIDIAAQSSGGNAAIMLQFEKH